MIFHLHFGIKTRKHSFSKSESPKNIFTTPRIVSFPHSKQSITPVIYNHLQLFIIKIFDDFSISAIKATTCTKFAVTVILLEIMRV